jgi:hypothetical protein
MICYGKFIANINRRQGAYVESCGIDQRKYALARRSVVGQSLQSACCGMSAAI